MKRQITGDRREADPQFSAADRAFVLSEADIAQEASLGYDLCALLAQDASLTAPASA